MLPRDEPAAAGNGGLLKTVPVPSQGTGTPLRMEISQEGMLLGEIRSLRGHQKSHLEPGIDVWTPFPLFALCDQASQREKKKEGNSVFCLIST